ncbi:MAG: FecR domain-containing protein [Pseudomonadota bacterium]
MATNSDQSLDAQALQLVETALMDPSAANRDTVDRWAAQSAEHREAVAAARKFHALASSIRPRELSAFESLRLCVQVWITRLVGQLRESSVLVGLVLLILGGLVTLWQFSPSTPITDTPIAQAPVPTEAFQTGYRQRETIELTDGSTVWLDWHTSIETRFSADQRLVSVTSGKAAFQVVPDIATRPFIVEAGKLQTTVTGTEFTVENAGNGEIEVAVVEGRVLVGSEQNSVALGAESVIQFSDGEFGPVRQLSSDEIGAWRDGLVVFRDRPLTEALHALEPYTSYQIDTSQLFDGGQRVSGTFFVERGDAALQAIFETHRLNSIVKGRNTLVIRGPRLQRPN